MTLADLNQERQLSSHNLLLTSGSPCYEPFECFNFSFKEIQEISG